MHRSSRVELFSLVLLLAISGCSWPQAPGVRGIVPPVASPLPAVSIYGDSLTVPASEGVSDRLKDSVDLTINAYPGTDLSTWEGDVLASRPVRLVLALGTNDANHDGVGPWRTLLSELSPATCVVWPRPYQWSDHVTAFVDDMDALLTEFPNVHVIEWGAQVVAHREWLLPDGIHYDADGTAAYTSMLVDAVDTCLV